MRFIPLLLLYTALRALFLVLHSELFVDASPLSLVAVFAAGLLFDLAALSWINLPYLLMLVGARFRAPAHRFDILLNVLFLVLNLPFLLLNVADLEYFRYTGERANASLFDLTWDISKQSGQMAFYFWGVSLLGAIVSVALCLFLPKGSPQAPPSWRGRGFAWQAALLAAGVVLLTAGWGVMTWHPITLDDWSLRQAALNSSITMFRGWEACGEARRRPSNTAAIQPQARVLAAHGSGTAAPQRHDNIVLIVVESLSTEYTGLGKGRSYTPFLDRLAKEGLSFTHHFANGRRSIDALSSVLLGVPRLRESTHRCVRNKPIDGFASVLKQRGHRTMLFHGGWNGTLGLDAFSAHSGFERYYSADDYPGEHDSAGALGIHDGPFLLFAAAELERRPEPFAAVIMTVSTHQPYELPRAYRDAFPKGELPIHRSVGYFDHSLERFFAAAKKAPWFHNTLFIITGDHTGPAENLHSRLIETYRVPLVFYRPGRKLPDADLEAFVQHVDIGPTILQYLEIPSTELAPFGRNVFDRSAPGVAFGQIGGEWWIAADGFYLETASRRSKLFEWEQLNAPVESEPKRRELETQLQEIVARYDATLAGKTAPTIRRPGQPQS
jgi:phosphoglycerol transferase MdoB-like AlkP superfamily enzyme